MQKFIRVIVGLFILLTILNPIIIFIDNRLTTDQLPAMAAQGDRSQLSTNILSSVNSVAEKREQLASDLYARDLSKQIRATIMSIDGVANAKVIVNIEPSTPDNKRVGKIQNVLVYIEPGITNGDRKVAKVTIGNTASKIGEESNTLSSAVADKALRTVTELYQLNANQVQVLRMN